MRRCVRVIWRYSTSPGSFGLDQEDDPGHHERDADDQQRDGELVHPAGQSTKPHQLDAPTSRHTPGLSVKAAQDPASPDRLEEQDQDAEDR
jgi:hypothetical protein